MGDATRVVIAAVLVGLIVAFAIPVYDTVTGTTDEFKADERVDETVNIEDETGSFVNIRASAFGDNQTVRDSRGHAIRLTGASDSFVESDSTFSFATDNNWSVATWVRVNDSAGSKNMTAVSLDGRVLVQFNGSQGNWSVWYFDEGTTDSWRANISAPNQPGNLSLIIATHNGTHLQIFRNGTSGDVVNTSAGDNIADIQINSTNWDGDVDETRSFDGALNASQRSALLNDPIGPLKNATRTARLMYDAGSGTHINIYWANTDATGSNISYVNGLAGTTLTENTLLVSGDYDWRDDGPEIRPRSGGELDGAPAVFVEYDLTNSAGLSVSKIADAIELVPVIILVMIAGVIIVAVRRAG